MTLAPLRASRSVGLDVLGRETPPTAGRVPVHFTSDPLAEGVGADGDVIRIKLGRLAHADVGLPGRRCRWASGAGAWQECSASSVARSAIPVPHAKVLGLGAFVLAFLLAGAWLLGRERTVIVAGMEAAAGARAAVQAAAHGGAGAAAAAGVGEGMGKALAPSPVMVPDSSGLEADGTLPQAGVPSRGAGSPVVARSALPAPLPVNRTTVPARTADGSHAAAPVTVRVPLGDSLPSYPHGPQGLPAAGAVAMPTAPGRLPTLVANAPASSAADGGPPLQKQAGAVAGAGAGAQPGATSGRQGGDWRDGTWDAARTVATVPSDSRPGPPAVGGQDASEHANAVAVVRPAAAARPAPVDARVGGDAPLKRPERAPQGGTRKSSRPRPVEGSAAVASASSKKRHSTAPQQDEPERLEPVAAPRPASAWQLTGHRERLVAILDTDTVVVPDSGGVPARFRLGDRLPSGARVVRIDPSHGRAETDRGTLFLE